MRSQKLKKTWDVNTYFFIRDRDNWDDRGRGLNIWGKTNNQDV